MLRLPTRSEQEIKHSTHRVRAIHCNQLSFHGLFGEECAPLRPPTRCWTKLMSDPPRKTEPQKVGGFGLRGSVGAGITGMFRANVTQVTVSSNRPE